MTTQRTDDHGAIRMLDPLNGVLVGLGLLELKPEHRDWRPTASPMPAQGNALGHFRDGLFFHAFPGVALGWLVVAPLVLKGGVRAKRLIAPLSGGMHQSHNAVANRLGG